MSRISMALVLSAAAAAAVLGLGTAWAAAPAGGAAGAAAQGAAPAADAPAAPAAGRRGGRGGRGGRGQGGGAAAPAVVIQPLASAVEVELRPPLDAEQGNYKVAPKTTWRDVKGIEVPEGTAKGTVTAFTMSGADSKAYPGTYTRRCWVYVPAGYVAGTELPFMLDHDGGATAVVQVQMIAAMDKLIAEKKIPMMAGVFVAPGGNRSKEYDTVSPKYCEFLESEVLPVAEKTGNVKLTKDPDARGTIGQSSGGAAAMAMVWFHPDMYTRLISYSGSFTQLQKDATYPRGAWEYHQTIIPNAEKKPLRLWLEVGSNDLNNQFGDWRVANNTLADVLKAKGYPYQFLWADGAGHVEGGVERQTMEEAMLWVWKTYKAK